MLHHKAATRIQRAWKKYTSPTCPKCSLPVFDPYSIQLPNYCNCSRCPGCLKFSAGGRPCSMSCEPWFPPMDLDSDTDEDDENLYEKWVKGNPVHTEDLGYYEGLEDTYGGPEDTYGGPEDMCIIN